MKRVWFVICVFFIFHLSSAQTIEKIFPGIWKITYGQPEKYLPTDFKEAPASEALMKIPDRDAEPFDLRSIQFKETPMGVMAEFTID